MRIRVRFGGLTVRPLLAGHFDEGMVGCSLDDDFTFESTKFCGGMHTCIASAMLRK